MKRTLLISFSLAGGIALAACVHSTGGENSLTKPLPVAHAEYTDTLPATFLHKLAYRAWEQTLHHVTYDGSYYTIKYPGGDVPDSIGVCTDVVIRAYRKLGYDLQKLIHEDMKAAHTVYNKRRYSEKIDSNIDHRRTPNMETFFTRKGAKLAVTDKEADYQPGDLVFWDVAYGHVGIVVNKKVPGTNRNYIVHNICCGNKMEDFLFGAKILGHYRWKPAGEN